MHSLIQNIVVEAAWCGRQHPQGPQNESRLLAWNCLLQLFHMLFDICGGPEEKKKKNVTSNSFYSLPLLTSSSREPLKKMWPVTSFALIGLSSTYGCHTILRYNQETKKNKARVEKRVEGDRKRKGKKMRKKTNTWRFIKFLHRKTF